MQAFSVKLFENSNIFRTSGLCCLGDDGQQNLCLMGNFPENLKSYWWGRRKFLWWTGYEWLGLCFC